ncbi:MAG: hypothetical protein IIB87_07630 [Chloroflexi bacterium]|nr:hypothetical protein [Chloroflexota bacterium]
MTRSSPAIYTLAQMADLFFSDVLLPDGWAASVRVSIAADGSIESVTRGSDADGCELVTGIAVPGVPNLHSHAFQRAMAGLAERSSERGDSFWGWRERMYAFLERLDPDDVEAVAAQLMEELPSIEPNPVATAIADLAGRVGESVDGLKAALQEHAEMMARQEAGKA